jgi:hypothetical protein
MLMQEIRAEINKRVQKRLVEELFDPLLVQHQKHGLKLGCKCNFCTTRMIRGSRWRARRKAMQELREASWLMPTPERFPSFHSLKHKWKYK